MSVLLMTGLAYGGAIAAKGMIETTRRVKAEHAANRIEGKPLLAQPGNRQTLRGSDGKTTLMIREYQDDRQGQPVRYVLFCPRETGGHFDLDGGYSCN